MKLLPLNEEYWGERGGSLGCLTFSSAPPHSFLASLPSPSDSPVLRTDLKPNKSNGLKFKLHHAEPIMCGSTHVNLGLKA